MYVCVYVRTVSLPPQDRKSLHHSPFRRGLTHFPAALGRQHSRLNRSIKRGDIYHDGRTEQDGPEKTFCVPFTSVLLSRPFSFLPTLSDVVSSLSYVALCPSFLISSPSSEIHSPSIDLDPESRSGYIPERGMLHNHVTMQDPPTLAPPHPPGRLRRTLVGWGAWDWEKDAVLGVRDVVTLGGKTAQHSVGIWN